MRKSAQLALLFVILASFMGNAGLGAQESGDPDPSVPRPPNDSIPFAPLAAPSHLWMGWPEGVMYEGNLNLPAHLWSRTSALTEADSWSVVENPTDCLPEPVLQVMHWLGWRPNPVPAWGTKPATGCTVTFVPHFVIRQVKGGSAPVRTPTFNPTLEINWYRFAVEDSVYRTARLQRADRRGSTTRDTGYHAILLTNHIRAGHYSNGQAGCLYANQVYDLEKGVCVVQPDLSDTLNRVDGSFSTHYLEYGATGALIRFDAAGKERHLQSFTILGRVNPGGWVATIGGMNDELARTYGRWSLSANHAVRTRANSLGRLPYRNVRTVVLEGECAFKRPDPYRNCRGSIEARLSFPGMYGFGFSARYVTGWDYYNVGYGDGLTNERGWWPIFGIVLDHSVAMRINRRRRNLD
jgi:hypothetical protein